MSILRRFIIRLIWRWEVATMREDMARYDQAQKSRPS